MRIQRALISVSDKSGLAAFAARLVTHDVQILSTGGTAEFLRDNGIDVVDVSDYTGSPELFGGRLKTLHPKVHGGILQRRDNPKDRREADENDVPQIDLVVVNLYPFEATIAKQEVTREQAIEQIDIGGPTMLRSAAKNYTSVTVVTDPADYDAVLEEMDSNGGGTTAATRERLALKVFQHTASYDRVIANYLGGRETAGHFSISLPRERALRYGENSHQKASLYGSFSDFFTQLQGKDLSYTNVLDIETAAELVSEFARPTVAILKHTNPCGVGSDSEDLRAAWEKAFETDRQAPFGGVIVCNRPLTAALARVIREIFTDVIIAPGFETDARALLQKKKNLRLIEMAPEFKNAVRDPVIRSVPGGIIVMDPDPKALGLDKLEENVVTQRPPSRSEVEGMRFAWRIAKYVKSNAIVFATSDRTLGIGAGQMSRIDACRIAVWKAKEAGLSLQGSVVASDAMFPFPDGLVTAAEAGATAAIQPGGSVNDADVIAAADQREVAMVFTHFRHFRH